MSARVMAVPDSRGRRVATAVSIRSRDPEPSKTWAYRSRREERTASSKGQ